MTAMVQMVHEVLGTSRVVGIDDDKCSLCLGPIPDDVPPFMLAARASSGQIGALWIYCGECDRDILEELVRLRRTT